MNNRKYLSSLAISIITVFALVFNGCSSTDSDSDDDPVNENGNGSGTQVSFSSGDIAPDGTYSYTFNEEGEVEYYCEIHAPDMQGKIIVSSSTDAVESDTVSMENDQFVPEELTVAPSTEVVWVNNENHTHNIRTGNPSSGDDGSGGY